MARGPINWLVEKLNPAQPQIHTRQPFASPQSNVDFRAAYDQIEVIHRAVEMIVSACVEIPFEITDGGPAKKLNKLLNEIIFNLDFLNFNDLPLIMTINS